jgi:outer membrane protein TolC
MRWKSLIGGLALLATLAGCAKQCYMTEGEYHGAHEALLPAALDKLERDTNVGCAPVIDVVTQAPPTPNDPERKSRYVSLAECEAIALEQGTVGATNFFNGLNLSDPANPTITGVGVIVETPVTFFGGQVSRQSDAIRVLALDPALIGANIEASLSKFDAVFTGSMSWQNTDRPVGTPIDAFQTGNTGLNAIVQADATFTSGILKPLPTGGVAGITFSTAYQETNLPARVNPNYRPTLQFQFEQPLLQGFGVEINQVRSAHPGSVLTPGVLNTQTSAEGILITRLRFDQSRAEFERNVTNLLLNVEAAYWRLYGSYWNLYAQEQGMRQAFVAWQLSQAKFQAGRATKADVAQSRGQFESFRSGRITAVDRVLEAERQLRGFLQLHVEDGTRLVPSDTPTLARFQPDWATGITEAMSLRPELVLAREDVKANQLNVIAQKNNLLPDLRFTATYDVNDIGSRLDGPDATNAFRNLSSDHFNNWALGVRLNVPLGYRVAQANLRIARLNLARSYETLRDSEYKAERQIALVYRLIQTRYDQIIALRAQREAFAEQLETQFRIYQAGKGTLDILLEAQSRWAQALATEYTAISDYQGFLAGWYYATGTLLEHDNIVISEGALPGCVQVRAVEHERRRTAALVTRERALPVTETTGLPKLCDKDAPSIPSLWKSTPPLQKEPDPLPVKSDEVGALLEGKADFMGPVAPPPAAMPETPKKLPPLPPPPKSSTFGTLRPTSPPLPDVPRSVGSLPPAPVPVEPPAGKGI